MTSTHELCNALIPTRIEKRRLGRQLGHLNESTIYKWCQDPAASGTRNWIDVGEAMLEHAAAHHPNAAWRVIRHLEAVVKDATEQRAVTMSPVELLLSLQPASEKELGDVLTAFSAQMRRVILTEECDLGAVLKELNDAGEIIRKGEVMIEALLKSKMPLDATALRN